MQGNRAIALWIYLGSSHLVRKFCQRDRKRVIDQQNVARIRPNVTSADQILHNFRQITFNQGCKNNAENIWR